MSSVVIAALGFTVGAGVMALSLFVVYLARHR